MTYYHIVATWNPDNSVTKEIFSDLASSEVKSRFVRPYLRGHHVLAGNDHVDVTQITKLLIVKTDRPSDEVRSRLNDESLERIAEMNSQCGPVIISAGSGYSPEDILDGGQDVTHQFIKGAAGSKKGIPWYITFILTVAGGVMIAGIVWYLGWK